jgi:hypothetical protein
MPRKTRPRIRSKPDATPTPVQIRKLRAKLDREVEKFIAHAKRLADRVDAARATMPRHALLISNQVVLKANRAVGDLETLGVTA